MNKPAHSNESGILKGVRVLDFSCYLAGPFCASILGDLGAEVIRVEPIGGGQDRQLAPVTSKGDGAVFLQLNRNKKSIAIDVANPSGRNAVEALVPSVKDALKYLLEKPRHSLPDPQHQSLAGHIADPPCQSPKYWW